MVAKPLIINIDDELLGDRLKKIKNFIEKPGKKYGVYIYMSNIYVLFYQNIF